MTYAFSNITTTKWSLTRKALSLNKNNKVLIIRSNLTYSFYIQYNNNRTVIYKNWKDVCCDVY
jgi:hypothetical protein